jgi:16S rRNA G966 N2-methylase RsmD
MEPDATRTQLDEPYRKDLVGKKGSVFYRAHSYHTKVPVEGLVRLVEHYTNPGDLVVDPFCGSGQTGVAAILTGRRAVISDISPAAVHIARGYTVKIDPDRFLAAARTLLGQLSDLEGLLYGTDVGRLEYTVFSHVYRCPECHNEIRFWDAAVDLETGQILSKVCCGRGHGPFSKGDLEFVRTTPVQENISSANERRRVVRPVATAARPPVTRADIDYWYPTAPWEPWREMWRQQHRTLSIASAADFFTDRNLFALGAIWQRINQVPEPELRDALRFTFTAIVNRASKRYQWHPSRPTNVLSSTMYVAALHYEFNVFSLLRRKVTAISDLYRRTWNAPGTCEVIRASATDLGFLRSGDVDYVFTDPPFGSNIFYADSSFLWEAWLNDFTDQADEAVVSKRLPDAQGGKSLDDYGELMAQSMAEIRRVVKPRGWVSIQFHNSDDKVWSVVQRAVETGGLAVEAAIIMDKGQASFKGLRHASRGEKVADFDLVMHARLASGSAQETNPIETELVIDELVQYMAGAPAAKRTTPWAHSTVMRMLLSENADLEGWSFERVESLCEALFERAGTGWKVREP